MFNLFFQAIVLGLGLVVGGLIAFGFIRIIMDTADLICLTIRAKFGIPKVVRYVFGQTYNDYQTLIINNSKWKVMPSALAHVKLLKALDGTERYLVLSEFESEHLYTQNLMEDSRETETKASA